NARSGACFAPDVSDRQGLHCRAGHARPDASRRSRPRPPAAARGRHHGRQRALGAAAPPAARLELTALTLYAFSTENWKRPHFEVATLMALLKEYLRRELKTLLDNDIVFRVVGRMDGLDSSVQRELEHALAATVHGKGMIFNIALNYSGRAELADAMRALAKKVKAGVLCPEDIDEAAIESELYTAGLPDPDLLIRTSGEMRISNYLLWQIAYAEIHVTPVLWPDFRAGHFLEALAEFQKRERRYGGVSEAEERRNEVAAPAAHPAAASR